MNSPVFSGAGSETPGGSVEERLEAVIEHVRYMDHVTGFVAARVRSTERRGTFNVKGELGEVHPGQVFILWGRWVVDRVYGVQFSVSRWEPAAPVTKEGIEKFITGFVDGIGPAMAKKIVGAFGKEAIDIIEKNPERLCEVDGIGPKRAARITEAWDSRKEVRDVMLFLQSHGVSLGHAWKIWRCYGKGALNLLMENPYRLSMDISGIGFLTADKIARRLGVPEDSPARLQAGVLHILEGSADDGHCYLPLERLLKACSGQMGMPAGAVCDAIDRLVSSGRLNVEKGAAGREGRGGETVFLKRFYDAERHIALRLSASLRTPSSIGRMDGQEAVDWVRKGLSITPDEGQIAALRSALENKVTVITGGPGTGKTTLISGLTEIFKGERVGVALSAPTGRAARRMSETTGHEAKTIHRLLEYNPGIGGFQRNEHRPLDSDVIIVDEASMVDVLLMDRLISAVKPGTKLILVGDVNQLPSVGAGNMLQDVIASKTIPVISLMEVFRQARRSMIVVNAHRINSGKMPLWAARAGEEPDFFFIEQGDPSVVVRIIKELVKVRIPRRFGFEPMGDIQVLSPMHRGIAGTTNLNLELQKTLNPSREGIVRGQVRFCAGDKVMQIHNDYEKEVFNGDIGRIDTIDERMRQCRVVFDGRAVSYDFADMDSLSLAYASSVHKSQGSEYPAVVFPVLEEHHIMLQRNLLYTAVTRARKLVVIVGTKRALGTAVSNDHIRRRFTSLGERLKKACSGLAVEDS
jgi:exodeoxyribonuclease V alpha subunit